MLASKIFSDWRIWSNPILLSKILGAKPNMNTEKKCLASILGIVLLRYRANAKIDFWEDELFKKACGVTKLPLPSLFSGSNLWNLINNYWLGSSTSYAASFLRISLARVLLIHHFKLLSRILLEIFLINCQ